MIERLVCLCLRRLLVLYLKEAARIARDGSNASRMALLKADGKMRETPRRQQRVGTPVASSDPIFWLCSTDTHPLCIEE